MQQEASETYRPAAHEDQLWTPLKGGLKGLMSFSTGQFMNYDGLRKPVRDANNLLINYLIRIN